MTTRMIDEVLTNRATEAHVSVLEMSRIGLNANTEYSAARVNANTFINKT